MFDGQRIPRVLAPDHALIISSATGADAGTYQCVAENMAQTRHSSPAFVAVRGRTPVIVERLYPVREEVEDNRDGIENEDGDVEDNRDELEDEDGDGDDEDNRDGIEDDDGDVEDSRYKIKDDDGDVEDNRDEIEDGNGDVEDKDKEAKEDDDIEIIEDVKDKDMREDGGGGGEEMLSVGKDEVELTISEEEDGVKQLWGEGESGRSAFDLDLDGSGAGEMEMGGEGLILGGEKGDLEGEKTHIVGGGEQSIGEGAEMIEIHPAVEGERNHKLTRIVGNKNRRTYTDGKNWTPTRGEDFLFLQPVVTNCRNIPSRY